MRRTLRTSPRNSLIFLILRKIGISELETVLAPIKHLWMGTAMMSNRSESNEPMFTVLNPVGFEPEREIRGINPRLENLEGKKVLVVNLHGGNEEAIESVGPDLKASVPDCNVISFRTNGGFGGIPLTEEDWNIMLDCDAAVLGHNY